MQGLRLRVAEAAKDRVAQTVALASLLIGSAALAAPAVTQASLVSRTTTAIERASLTLRPALAAPEVLVWEGADLDGDGAADFANPTGKGVRGHDAYGYGQFGASRDGGVRQHEGVDFMADAGQPVDAPISGYVTKIGYAYADDANLKFVEITNPALHYAARVFYVDPEVQVGQTVALGSEIGRHHTLARKYPGGMTDHVHLEILDKRGRRIDGTEMIPAKQEPGDRLAAD
jgi:murein DD-endopeptidase MepM/ murein hydrolase activator NlpD